MWISDKLSVQGRKIIRITSLDVMVKSKGLSVIRLYDIGLSSRSEK